MENLGRERGEVKVGRERGEGKVGRERGEVKMGRDDAMREQWGYQRRVVAVC